jgi:nicotinate-nucleotide pyrophosphorylase (carboxylating)
MSVSDVGLPPFIVIDRYIAEWLQEDIGRGDRTTQGLSTLSQSIGDGIWNAKGNGIIAGLPIAARVFQVLNERVSCTLLVDEGDEVSVGQTVLQIRGPMDSLLMGERVALNLVMRLSGIATTTRQFVEAIADLPACLVDTRKTTPGLRLLEKYASRVGGAVNHRMGLDDAVMIKDNHIVAAGGIEPAIAQIRPRIPYPTMIEVETETIAQVKAALTGGADIIMLDNMPTNEMRESVALIRDWSDRIRIEASGNITLKTIRNVAQTGVDYISSSAPITRSPWLDLSMKMCPSDLNN